MRTLFLLTIKILTCSIFVCCCTRGPKDFVEDTKSAGKYLGKGLRSLGGKQYPHRRVGIDDRRSVEPHEDDYVAIDEDDLYEKIALGDGETLGGIDLEDAIPASKEDPGKVGGSIPGIDGFLYPSQLGIANIFSNIHFATNSCDLNEAGNFTILHNISEYLKSNESTYLFVEGHCDKRGTRAYNLALGMRRSNAIRVFLIKDGVHPDRIFTISYGKERPLVFGDSMEILRKNRRGEFKIYEKVS